MNKIIQIPKMSLKKALELAILSLIKNGACDANGIMKKIETIGFTVPKGTLYPLLSKLRKDKIISPGFNEDIDPPERCYDITEKGLARLSQLTKEWKDINRLIRHSGSNY